MDRDTGRGSPETVGTLLLLAAAAAFSATGYFARVAPVAPAAMIFWRNLFGSLGLIVALSAHRSNPLQQLRLLSLTGWMAVACTAGSMVCYLAAFAYTSVANISIIYAGAPMVTALLAWLGLGERPAPRTIAAAGVALTGVVFTMAGSIASVSLVGDGLALLMTLGLSGVAVLARGQRLPPLSTALASALAAAAAAVALAAGLNVDLAINVHEAGWLCGFGVVTMALAWPLSLAGLARVPAARAMLISSFELPLAPLWVWLAFGETPSAAATAGGALVLTAVLWETTAVGKSRVRSNAARQASEKTAPTNVKGAPKRPSPTLQ